MSKGGAGGKLELVRKIVDRIMASKDSSIPFREFMAMCLYDPEFGYYTGPRLKIGREGDFYTSAGIGGLMGELLADYAVRECPSDEPMRIIEWGAGNGAMAGHLLNTLQAIHPERYRTATYTIVERSPYHRALQQETLREHGQKLRILTPEEWEGAADLTIGFPFVYSNELLDSFPVERVRQRGKILMELGVGWNAKSEMFVEKERRCVREELHLYLRKAGIQLLDGQTADLNLAGPQWIHERLSELKRVLLLTIDYGDTAAELFGPHRMTGTLMTYRRHIAGTDPYLNVGEQDLTAHVDFSACLWAGEQLGVSGQRLMTQREFLVDAGILNRLQEHANPDPFGPEARRNRAIRQLLLSDGMSELFKVLIQKKG